MTIFKSKKSKEVDSEIMLTWLPPNDGGRKIDVSPEIQRLQLVTIIQNPRNAARTKLQNYGFGVKFYRKYLKHHFFVRSLILWLWNNVFPLYLFGSIHLSNRQAKRFRRLVKLSDFAQKKNISRYKLDNSETVENLIPIVFPSCDQNYLFPPHDRYVFPEIVVYVINNAKTYGGTNFILVDEEVICHDLYDFARDYTSEERGASIVIDTQSNRIRWLIHDETLESIPLAATFVDACSENYAHWMTEVLPRIALFCAEERFQNIPVVVNDGLHQNIMESLFLVTGSERQIILLPYGHALVVDELYLMSATGYVPFERRNSKLSGHSHGIFSPQAFEALRKKMSVVPEKVNKESWPDKIYLRRNSDVRKVTNSAEIETLLVSQGYVMVEPEKLTFMQQLHLFRHVKAIVSPTGAALANAIFCMPGTQVIVIMGKHENMVYRYWCNMLNPIGINVGYVLGEAVNNHLKMHSDFVVDTTDVLSLLETMESQ